ncbi:hypothetical protein ATE48_17695 [Candidatus Viadribacter manganicus]|uniref:Uncharacterized protein n=2 Tax=Candidatus Viadribacter manganicus TaxID=1759059 RepID=A0A1B1AM06_9PROT|nr:hypothetical protein ATE48_17695 [Candidatus Viadribacter manganicus]
MEQDKTLLPRAIFPNRDMAHDHERRGALLMAMSRGRPAFATDDWMLEQQLRAEVEAEGWRSLRQKLAAPEPPPPPIQATVVQVQADHNSTGSTILKALVRFILAAFAAYLAWIAGVDARLGEFDVWMATGSTFAVVLALSMFGAARGFVHAAAETMRWILLIGIGFGATWLAFNLPL